MRLASTLHHFSQLFSPLFTLVGDACAGEGCHVVFVKPHLDLSSIPLAHFAGSDTKAVSAKQEEDIRSRITGYDERLADLDAMGLDMQLICPPPAQCFYTPTAPLAFTREKPTGACCNNWKLVMGAKYIDGNPKNQKTKNQNGCR